MPKSYRIAGRMSTKETIAKDLTSVSTESEFACGVRNVFARIRPRKIIETGTYNGTGSTTIIATALRDMGIGDAQFISIEVNPKNIQLAAINLAKAGLVVELINGLSVPRALLPTIQQIELEFVHDVLADDLIVDHEERDRSRLYFGETDFNGVPEDVLGDVLRRFDYQPDFVLLDSGGHMGFIEFNYVIQRLRGPCHIALDDIHHVKHYRSFQHLKQDRRFELIAASEEKFGFCIARFDPTAAP